jgi:hypothetical protein
VAIVRKGHIFIKSSSRTLTLGTLLVDSCLLKSLARGLLRRKLLETRDFWTREEFAEAENINPSYFSRVLRLTLLVPGYRRIGTGRTTAGGADGGEGYAAVSGGIWRHQSFPIGFAPAM